MATGEGLRKLITYHLGVISIILLVIYTVIAAILCQNGFEPLDMIDLLIAILGSLLAVYTTFSMTFQNRKDRFHETFMYMGKHYPLITKYALDAEKTRYSEETDKEHSTFAPCKKGWVPDKLTPMSDINVKIESQVYESPRNLVVSERENKDSVDSGLKIALENTVIGQHGLSYTTSGKKTPKGKSKSLKVIGRDLPYKRKTFAKNVQLLEGKNVVPYPTFALRKIEGNTITVGLGDYDDFYNSCQYLSYEVARNVFADGDRKRVIDLRGKGTSSLPVRKNMEPFRLDNRFAAIGVCTFTVLKNVYRYNDAYFLIHVRGNNVAEGPDSYHVVPAGSYQPTMIEDENGTSLINLHPLDTVIKEFSEEVLKKDGNNDLVSEEWLKEIHSKLKADVYYLGTVLEPVNLKAEMLALMVVDVRGSERNGLKILGIAEKFDREVEGRIRMFPLERKYLDQFKDNVRSIPACREAINIFENKEYEIGGEKTSLLNYLNPEDDETGQ